MSPATRKALEAFFNPATVAVWGSARSGKIAHQLVTQLVEGGFPGRLFAVNPKGEGPEGFPAVSGVPDLESIPGGVDLVLVAVPAEHVPAVVEACGRRGVPAAVVLTSGFSETGRREDEERVAAAARAGGVRLIGPNCAGIMSTPARLYASIEVRALPGRAAFLTQSGAVGGAVLALARDRGIGFSRFVSYGNRADLDEVDFLEYLEDDPGTAVIGLYLESLRDGPRFMETVARVARRKPVLVIKAGRSRAGLRAAGSHTGSLAGSDEVFDAVLRRCGALRVAGIEEMLDLCDGFCSLPLPAGDRVAVVTNSGGPGILASDRAEELGLEVAESGPQARAALRAFLPGHCALANPVDLTVEGTRENYRRTLRVLLDGDYDAAVAINVATPFLDSTVLAEGIAEAVREARPGASRGKPVAAVFMAGEMVEEGIRRLKAAGVPVFPTGERAMAVLAAMRTFARAGALPVGPAAGGPAPAGRPFPLQPPLLEPDLVRLLAGEGFPFPDHLFIEAEAAGGLGGGPAEDRWKAAQSLGFPLAMKVVSSRILHKSDAGGVVLNIRSPEQMLQAYARMRERFAGQDFRGVILYRQVEGGLEVIAGLKRDPDFGPVVLVGAGGVLTELIRDTALGVAPFGLEQAREMIDGLRIARLLRGYRGRPPLDEVALADLLVRLGDLALRYPQIRELDFNPVFVLERGLLIADARAAV